jgi:hypothetical protein
MEKQKKTSSSSQACTVSLQGCGASVASAAVPFNKKSITFVHLNSVVVKLGPIAAAVKWRFLS